MPQLSTNNKTAAVVSSDFEDRRNGKDRRVLADRRADVRYGDVYERRSGEDRRRPIGNLSID